MPRKVVWSNAQDSQIRRLRVEGASWDTIATSLGFTRWTVIERGHRIGASSPPRGCTPPPQDPARDPLPAGHARSWGVITAGTVLENAPYVLPAIQR